MVLPKDSLVKHEAATLITSEFKVTPARARTKSTPIARDLHLPVDTVTRAPVAPVAPVRSAQQNRSTGVLCRTCAHAVEQMLIRMLLFF